MKCSQHLTSPVNHSHRCSSCGEIWHHSEKSLDCVECHTCPSCGLTQFSVHGYRSDLETRVFKMAQQGISRACLVHVGVLAPGGLKQTELGRQLQRGELSPAEESALVSRMISFASHEERVKRGKDIFHPKPVKFKRG
jgi:predicted  nucleic acid-binding Zn-ribbon protein